MRHRKLARMTPYATQAPLTVSQCGLLRPQALRATARNSSLKALSAAQQWVRLCRIKGRLRTIAPENQMPRALPREDAQSATGWAFRVTPSHPEPEGLTVENILPWGSSSSLNSGLAESESSANMSVGGLV